MPTAGDSSHAAGTASAQLQQSMRGLPVLAKELMAGGVAGGLSKTSVAPLERVKILFQTGQMHGTGVGKTLVHIYRSEGAPGFFKLLQDAAPRQKSARHVQSSNVQLLQERANLTAETQL